MKGRARLVLWVLLLLCLLPVLVTITMRLSTMSRSYTESSKAPKTRVAVVLGASVVRGEPSPTLAKRADAAIELYKSGRVDVVLVTGDNGGEHYDEVTPVRNYMVEQGVPEDKIFLDNAGFDTYSSMYRAINTFQADTMTIVTQDFHMPRALFIARALGAEAYGVVAEGEAHTVQNYLREIPASNKALLDLIFGRLPERIW